MTARTFVLSIFIALIASSCSRSLQKTEWRSAYTAAPAASLRLPRIPAKLVTFETTEGTLMSVDVSSDGSKLVFDLLGDIYELSINGGDAVALTEGYAWDQAPRYSPDGNSVFFVSDRNGFKNVWRIDLGSGDPTQVTSADSDIVGTPNWSQDGTHLVAGVRANAESILHAVDPHTGNTRALERPNGPWRDSETSTRFRSQIQAYSGVQTNSGYLYFSEPQLDWDAEFGHTVVKLFGFDPDKQVRTLITPPGASYHEYKPQLSRDGRFLSYFRQYDNRRTEIRIRELSTGHDRPIIELTNADDASMNATNESKANYAFTPDNQHLVFWHDGQIHRINIFDGSSSTIPFRVKVERQVWPRALPQLQRFHDTVQAQAIRWPTVSRDGKTMAFCAIGYVWVMDLTTQAVRRLTRSNDFEYMPAISPDGNSVAYTSFVETEDNFWPGRLMVASLNQGNSYEVLSAANTTFLIPKWSPDGSKIALVREQFRDNASEASFGWTSITEGKFREISPAPSTGEYKSVFNYSRSVTFDATGRNLLLSFPFSTTETVLSVADLYGNNSRILAVGAEDVRGINVSPNLDRIVLTRDDGTNWIVPFVASEERTQISTFSVDAQQIGHGAGYYVDWTHSRELTFGFGQHVYRYRVDDDELDRIRVNLEVDTPEASRPIAFAGARLITMTDGRAAESVVEQGTILVDGKRIIAIGPMTQVEVPTNATVVDIDGKTIIPGLLDTHYHSIGDGFSAYELPDPSLGDISAIAYGITSAWEPSGPVNDGSPATVDMQLSGRILGPRWSHAAVGAVGNPWERLTSYSAAIRAVKKHQALGVDVLKEYNTPTRRQRRWLSAAAHQQHLGIVSHIENFDGMMTRVIDGYTGGDHPYIPIPFFRDVRELLRQTGFVWTPNVMTTSGSSGSWQDVRSYFWQKVLIDRASEANKLKALLPSYRDVKTMAANQSTEYSNHRVAQVTKQISIAKGAGVNIGVSAHGEPGINLHGEMWHLWKGGMPIEDVLYATTIGNAEKLGLQEEVGSLEVGKIADFLLLSENPLDDILNTLSIEYTVQGGVIYDADTVERVDPSKLPACEADKVERGVCLATVN